MFSGLVRQMFAAPQIFPPNPATNPQILKSRCFRLSDFCLSSKKILMYMILYMGVRLSFSQKHRWNKMTHFWVVWHGLTYILRHVFSSVESRDIYIVYSFDWRRNMINIFYVWKLNPLGPPLFQGTKHTFCVGLRPQSMTVLCSWNFAREHLSIKVDENRGNFIWFKEMAGERRQTHVSTMTAQSHSAILDGAKIFK